MEIHFEESWKIKEICSKAFDIPFTPRNYGFFISKQDETFPVELMERSDPSSHETIYTGTLEGLIFTMQYENCGEYLGIRVRIENTGDDFDGRIGFHTGVDTYMESYPQWHDVFFPTLLRCEKTHLWGYFMNTAENALAIATDAPVASYDLQYNGYYEDAMFHGLHRIFGADILFYQNTILPARHPQHLRVMKAGEVYTNLIYLIPVENKTDIKPVLSRTAHIPVADAVKYTKMPGETLEAVIYSDTDYVLEMIQPDGSVCTDLSAPMLRTGMYLLKAEASNGKTCEAAFYVRNTWEYYLKQAALNALSKPPKASTHNESFEGLYTAFLYYKHSRDEEYGKKAYAAFEEAMPYMFDFERCVPITIPNRIQNTACFISLLVDGYEADPENRFSYLEKASRFADFIMSTQSDDGAYRNQNTHYTCVIYIAKSMLELYLAEQKCGDAALLEKSRIHYESAKKAIDELVRNRDNITTEGELTLEDGMIACGALQLAMFALLLPEEERKPYTDAAEYMLKIHACLEQQLIPDCRCNGASLRYWESQYDVMIRVNMLNSPHGWTSFTLYAKYYLYLLTGKREYLVGLHNGIGSCMQLIDETGNLRWGFCSQPYVKGMTFVPDYDKEIQDGYQFVESGEKAYRGKYVVGEFCEQYIDMISGWYRIGEQKVTGGYEFCPLFMDGYIDTEADTQGGCCDNDVHEVFKCMEETVFKKVFVHEEEDGSLLTYGCRATIKDGVLSITAAEEADSIVYSLKTPCMLEGTDHTLSGFGQLYL